MCCGMSRYASDSYSDSESDYRYYPRSRRTKTDYYRPQIRPSRNAHGGYGPCRRRHDVEFSMSHRRGDDLYFAPRGHDRRDGFW